MGVLASKMSTAVVAIASFVLGVFVAGLMYEFSPTEKDEVISKMSHEFVKSNELMRDMDYLNLYSQYSLKLEIFKEIEKASLDYTVPPDEVAALEGAVPSLECMSAKILDSKMRSIAEDTISDIKEFVEQHHNKSSKGDAASGAPS
jgi:hypothetical protein